MYYLKSYIYGHRIHQPCSLADSAQSRLIRPGYLAGRFFGHRSRISNKVYSQPLMMHGLTPCKYPVESISILSKFFSAYCARVLICFQAPVVAGNSFLHFPNDLCCVCIFGWLLLLSAPIHKF